MKEETLQKKLHSTMLINEWLVDMLRRIQILMQEEIENCADSEEDEVTQAFNKIKSEISEIIVVNNNYLANKFQEIEANS